MRIYRVIKLTNGNYRVEYFESMWLFNPCRKWKPYGKEIYKFFQNAEALYLSLIKDRDNNFKRRNILMDKIVKTEEIQTDDHEHDE